MATIISRRYEVLGQLGQGGMGTVYKVRHTALETILALKVLPTYLMENQDIVARFVREARVMARLNHPNIVRVLDIERDESLNLYYFVMEYIEGETLGQYLRQKGPLPLPEVIAIGKQVAHALEYAHNHHPPIIHRDIKPANIMIEARSNRVVVMDFGIAKELGGPERTKTEVMIGTLKYASPEQLRHEPLEGSADVYSLGMVLYEMYTGKQFFAGLDENAVLGKVLYEARENEPHFDRPTPAPFVELVTKAIAKTRTQRYQRMADLLQALETCHPQGRQEEGKAKGIEQQERELEEERQMQVQVQEARGQAAREGAAEWAVTLFQQGLAREERAKRNVREHDFSAAQQARRDAIALFGQAREEARKAISLRNVERLRQEQKEQRQAIEGEQEGQERTRAQVRELDAQAGPIYDRDRIEAEALPETVFSHSRQTTGQPATKRWGRQATVVLGIVVISAAVIWFVAIQKKSPLHTSPPQGKVPPPSSTTPVSSTSKPPPTDFPPPLSPPVPEKNQSPPLVTKPAVTELLLLGQFFQDRGQYDEAIKELEKAKGQYPDNADILAALQRAQSAKEAEDRRSRSP